MQRAHDIAVWVVAFGALALAGGVLLDLEPLLFISLPVFLLGASAWMSARGVLVFRHGVGRFWLTHAIAPEHIDTTAAVRRWGPVVWFVGGGYVLLGGISGLVGLLTLLALPRWLTAT